MKPTHALAESDYCRRWEELHRVPGRRIRLFPALERAAAFSLSISEY